MIRALRVLLVEDSDDDAFLVLRELKRGGFEPVYERVDTRAAFQAALQRKWDIIISDYTIPGYGGLDALNDVREDGRDIPFILVSGTIGETAAVSAMRAGAHDYVLKDQLTRLPAVVEREVREAAIRADQRELRERLVISERMASTGTLAAAVAHEINNPLAVTMANLDFVAGVLSQLGKDSVVKDASGQSVGASGKTIGARLEEIAEPLADAREALFRIRDTVRDVKLFSRGEVEQADVADVRRIMDSAIRMAWNEIRQRARLVREYGEVPMVEANESRLGQVFLSLIVNAVRSLPEGDAQHHEIQVIIKANGPDHVYIAVRDTGRGLPQEDLENVFEPVFTVKRGRAATGLGLVIAHRIVSDMGGEIRAESDANTKGTRFLVTLPTTKKQLPIESKKSATPPAPRRAKVLVVDDDEAVCRAVKRSLSRHHDVTVTNNGADAIERMKNGERYDAILCDLMMPDMTGMDVYHRLVEVAPDQSERMIFLTGGAFSAKAGEFLLRIGNPHLEKPFDVPGLLTLIGTFAPAGGFVTAGTASA